MTASPGRFGLPPLAVEREGRSGRTDAAKRSRAEDRTRRIPGGPGEERTGGGRAPLGARSAGPGRWRRSTGSRLRSATMPSRSREHDLQLLTGNPGSHPSQAEKSSPSGSPDSDATRAARPSRCGPSAPSRAHRRLLAGPATLSADGSACLSVDASADCVVDAEPMYWSLERIRYALRRGRSTAVLVAAWMTFHWRCPRWASGPGGLADQPGSGGTRVSDQVGGGRPRQVYAGAKGWPARTTLAMGQAGGMAPGRRLPAARHAAPIISIATPRSGQPTSVAGRPTRRRGRRTARLGHRRAQRNAVARSAPCAREPRRRSDWHPLAPGGPSGPGPPHRPQRCCP